MTKTTKTEASKLTELFKLLGELSDDDRLEAIKHGVAIPAPTDGKLSRKYGYLCGYCSKPALIFIGEVFIDHYGNRVNRPPNNTPIEKLTWTQDVDPSKIDRLSPTCQHCGQNILLNGRYPIGKRIIDLEVWQRSQAESVDRMSKLRADLASNDGVGVDGSGGGRYKAPTMLDVMRNRVASGELNPQDLETAEDFLRQTLAPQ